MKKEQYACLKCGFIHDGKIYKDVYIREEYTGCRGGSIALYGTVKEQGIFHYMKCPKCEETKTIKSIPDKDGDLCQKCKKGKLVSFHRGGGPSGSIMYSLVCEKCENECNIKRSSL